MRHRTPRTRDLAEVFGMSLRRISAMCFTIYFLVFLEREIVYMIALKLLEPKTGELKVKGDVLDLCVTIGTLGSSL